MTVAYYVLRMYIGKALAIVAVGENDPKLVYIVLLYMYVCMYAVWLLEIYIYILLWVARNILIND